MRKVLVPVTLAGLSALLVAPAFAQAPNLQGGASSGQVMVAPSEFPPGEPQGYAGLRFVNSDGSTSSSISILDGPIKQISWSARANQPGSFYATTPILPIRIAQVWYNNQNAAANIYSLRQTLTPPFASAPKLGGLVVGQVKAANGAAYAAGNGVYFGEWSPQVSSPSRGDSTDLNMQSGRRTVWYAGDNAVTSMPALANAQYRVVGIRQTGVAGNLPHAPNLYAGTLVANYGGGSGSLAGSIVRGGDSINFAGTGISADGTFRNDSHSINGRFYNNAAALAGIYTGPAAADHVAFGGSRSN